MTITEVFPNPTVKEVHFEIRFPNLFYIEKKIGDFQIGIMKEFPISKEIFRRQVVLANLGPEVKLEDIPDAEPTRKIWSFESKDGVSIHVRNNSISIHSSRHKTYSNTAAPARFRDTIEQVLTAFFDTYNIPIITRIGLRYVDECPVYSRTNDGLMDWYNSIFPVGRFDFSVADEVHCQVKVAHGDHWLRYVETIKKSEGDEDAVILGLDIDAFTENIEPGNFLNITDELHDIASDAFESTAREPLYEYMRQEKE